MDTISIKLSINYQKEVSVYDINYIRDYFNNICSPYEHRYCNFLEMNNQDQVIIKVSYPRFYYGNNAYLVKNSKACLDVNNHLIEYLTNIRAFPYAIIGVSLIKVDIPFTYMMNSQHKFWYYENLYKIFAMVYTEKNKNSNPKMISTILDRRVETLNYADTKVIGNYNSKVMVYNQYQNLEDKLEEYQLKKVLEEFPCLTNRIRLEVSKRISRNFFRLSEFGNYDIYGEYYPKFKKYLLNNFFDIDIIEKYYTFHSHHLAEALKIGRTYRDFTYEVFILNNLHNIFDYEVLRRALVIAIDNPKTREGAITTVRKILKNFENSSEIIIMEAYKYLRDIRNNIENDMC